MRSALFAGAECAPPAGEPIRTDHPHKLRQVSLRLGTLAVPCGPVCSTQRVGAGQRSASASGASCPTVDGPALHCTARTAVIDSIRFVPSAAVRCSVHLRARASNSAQNGVTGNAKSSVAEGTGGEESVSDADYSKRQKSKSSSPRQPSATGEYLSSPLLL